jgi:hypothetical protein
MAGPRVDAVLREASEIALKQEEHEHYWTQRVLLDIGRLQIQAGDFDGAYRSISGSSDRYGRDLGLARLAEARTRSPSMKRGFDSVSALGSEQVCQKSDVQDSLQLPSIGPADAVRATGRRLIETGEFKDPWVKFSSLKASAVIAARMNDEQTARRLFRRAIDVHAEVNTINKMNALKQIVVAQARVGYIDDALKTASTFTGCESEFEELVYLIAMEQLGAKDAEGAMCTALSLRHFVQYRNGAFQRIVDYHIAKRDLNSALTAAEKIDSLSMKATAIIKVATALAKSGDAKTAADLAARIELKHADGNPGAVGGEHFDYRDPSTWGVCYDFGRAITMSSYHAAVQHAVEVAAAAMELSQSLGLKPAKSYSILFNEINTPEVIQSLARAHVLHGEASEALAWAKEIGSNSKVKPNDDRNAWAVERRIHALVGVAEGILDRSSKKLP